MNYSSSKADPGLRIRNVFDFPEFLNLTDFMSLARARSTVKQVPKAIMELETGLSSTEDLEEPITFRKIMSEMEDQSMDPLKASTVKI